MTSYFMTINGFHVKNETWDDPFQGDGKGDEIYITSVSKAQKRRYVGSSWGAAHVSHNG